MIKRIETKEDVIELAEEMIKKYSCECCGSLTCDDCYKPAKVDMLQEFVDAIKEKK